MNTGPRRCAVAQEAPAISPDQRLLDVRQAARYLSISVWTVKEMVASGRLARVDLGVRRVLVDRVTLDALIAPRSTVA